ncbi:outer membrane protein assembly factor BamB [Marinomonas ostreistagni]|uniref:outer membrane protein assembly factor BamB n=1 Tax=Marinomonas ostreistagni TaxID=359209 RepID=UPI00194E12F7|nr:outer membrane protein assembly factor BamB [Marinomonas ostreistagni]MBM6551699.1 outer membrane protein assembly factor BamB [Marinomonas ostreistagni]
MWKPMIAAVVTSAALLQGCSNMLPAPSSGSQEVNFQPSWHRALDGIARGEQTETFNIVARNNALYFVTDRGMLYEFNTSGDQQQAFATGIRPSSGVAVGEDKLFFGTYDAELVAASLDQKSVLWRKSLTSEVLAEAGAGEGRVAVQTGDGWLTVMDAQTGKTLWRDKEDIPALTIRGTTAPIIVDGKVITGFASGKVKAYNLQTGDMIWQYAVGKPEGRYEIERLSDVSQRLVVANGLVYSAAYNGTVTAIALQSGRPIWQRNIPSANSVAVNGSELAVVDQNSNVHLLNARNGSTIWDNEQLSERSLASPAFLKDYVAVLDRGGWVHLMNRTTGNIEAWTLADNKGPAGSQMVSSDGQLFILTPSASLTALRYW